MKKVFFVSTPRADKQLFVNFHNIYECIEELGYEHTSKFVKEVDPESFYKLTKQQRAAHYRRMHKAILDTDYCIFETTLHSLTIGQLVQFAIDKHKPVIALYTQSEPFFLDGAEIEEKRILVCHYTKSTLKKVLLDAFEYLEEDTNTRFTMILPNTMLNYLQQKTGEKGSVSEYIRSLIAEDMEKNL